MYNITHGTLLLLLLIPGAATAGRADICYTSASDSRAPVTNASAFHCPVAGSLTMPQLAAQGWRIHQIVPLAKLVSGTTFEYSTQLVIQEDSIFRAGFDS